MFDTIGEIADRVSAHPIFLIAFNIALCVLWVILGVEFANIFISIITAESVLIGAGAVRRGQLAIHAKLDEIIHAQDHARDCLIGIEKQSEKAILGTKIGD